MRKALTAIRVPESCLSGERETGVRVVLFLLCLIQQLKMKKPQFRVTGLHKEFVDGPAGTAQPASAGRGGFVEVFLLI